MKFDKGFITAMKTLNNGRIGVATQGIGVAQGAIGRSGCLYEGTQAVRPEAADFQALRFMMADTESKLNAARLLVYNAAYLMDMKQEVTKAASMAKYYATEAALEIVSNCLQMFGGYGYVKEYPIERMYRDARVLTIFEGTSQVQQMVIAGELFGK